MATIKAIEGRSIHQIQSGQVIVDLTSVVKELVENSLDAGATSIDVRFKAQGLDAIEVQDNGAGISSEDYESIGLKHYTSKLSTYNDLSSLDTFGFRGEALSSLCALSDLHIITAKDGEAPKGTRLDFEQSGKLKGTSVAATQKGTLVVVENLFMPLPVRRRELDKNIKREYTKVINILNAYACVSTGVRFTVSQQTGKGKKTIVFSTRNNLTTRENVANVYGAKTALALVALDLPLEMQPTAPSQVLKDIHNEDTTVSRQIKLEGHISKPVHGEGRQTPDRQMFFVNSRPCGLPQVAKAFNEVYRSYNISQSPFVFANFKMDTNAYDVNVSPDKRTIMLHDQQRLLESLKEALIDLFEKQDQTVPSQQLQNAKLPSYKPLNPIRQHPSPSPSGPNQAVAGKTVHYTEPSEPDEEDSKAQREAAKMPQSSSTSTFLSSSVLGSEKQPDRLISNFAGRNAEERSKGEKPAAESGGPSKDKLKLARKFQRRSISRSASASGSDGGDVSLDSGSHRGSNLSVCESRSMGETRVETTDGGSTLLTPAPIQSRVTNETNSTEKYRAPETPKPAMMTVGPTMSKVANASGSKRRRISSPAAAQSNLKRSSSAPFTSSLRAFFAPGTTQESADDLRQDDEERDSLSEDSSDSHQEEHRFRSGDSDDENESSSVGDTPYHSKSRGKSDGVPMEEQDRRRHEEARIKHLVEEAEKGATRSTEENERRAAKLMKRSADKIHNVMRTCHASLSEIKSLYHTLSPSYVESLDNGDEDQSHGSRSTQAQSSAEDRLSLKISKSDFANMRIIGQFNLGFILAVRPATDQGSKNTTHNSDELFIIDQHASDEIFNFHRLYASTSLTPQPLVRPHSLQLTATEEETIIDHQNASLAKNGFNVSIDTSGEKPVGERCSLLTLPTSKDTVFDTRDLEELLVMLSDVPAPIHASPPLPDVDTSDHLEGVSSHRTLSLSANSLAIVRPSKVRRMLAMRACRSSIMVGKALTHKGMAGVLKHMGEIDRPWNCPHGRPTMRHLSALDGVGGWDEWSGRRSFGDGDEPDLNEDSDAELGDGVWLPSSSQFGSGLQARQDESAVWQRYAQRAKRSESENEEEELSD